MTLKNAATVMYCFVDNVLFNGIRMTVQVVDKVVQKIRSTDLC